MIWLLGDLCNLVGAVMAGLQATVIILAIYVSLNLGQFVKYQLADYNFYLQYSLCDIALLFQIYYYRYALRTRLALSPTSLENDPGEDSPLLRSQTASNELKESSNKSSWKAIMQYASAFAFVILTGIVAWLVSQRGANTDTGPEPDPRRPKDVIEWKSQVIGWTSAVLYRKFNSAVCSIYSLVVLRMTALHAKVRANDFSKFVFSPPAVGIVGSRIPQISEYIFLRYSLADLVTDTCTLSLNLTFES